MIPKEFQENHVCVVISPKRGHKLLKNRKESVRNQESSGSVRWICTPASITVAAKRQYQTEPASPKASSSERRGRSFRDALLYQRMMRSRQPTVTGWSCCWEPGAGKWGQWAGGGWRRLARAGFSICRPPFVSRHLSCRFSASWSLSTTGPDLLL